MGNLSNGKYAYMISDRSGQRFPYQEMVTRMEWIMGTYF
jgi:ribosome modulation factor